MNFTVYSRPGCPYCTQVKQVLTMKKLPFTEHVLGQTFTRNEFYAKFGKGSTFPRVVLNDELIGGCQETVKYLRENNLV